MTDVDRQIVRRAKLADQGKKGDEHRHVVPDNFVEPRTAFDPTKATNGDAWLAV
jgi:hypothetical protein